MSKKTQATFALLGIFLLSTGPFGIALIFFFFLWRVVHSFMANDINDFLEGIYPESLIDPSESVYENLVLGKDKTPEGDMVVSLKDILSYGTYQQKRTAIEKLLKFYRPEFSLLLKQGLNDPSNLIRIQSATAILAVDKMHYNEIVNVEKQMKIKPKDIQLLKAYADKCYQYATLGVLETDRSQKFARIAIESYLTYFQKAQPDRDSWLCLAKLYRQIHDLQSCQKVLEEHLIDEGVTEETFTLFASLLFEQKEFSRLKILMNSSPGIGEAMKRAFKKWDPAVNLEAST